MFIWQPKHHFPIRRRTHVIPRVPLHDARPPFTRQPAHGLDLLRLHLHLALRIPHDRVPITTTPANQIPPVGAETHVPLAQRAGRAGRRAEVRGGVGALAVGAEGAFEGVEEEVALRVVGREEDRFAVIGELEAGPVRFRALNLLRREVGPHVEGREGGLVVVAEVVEEDGVRGRGGDGDDCCGWVVGG